MGNHVLMLNLKSSKYVRKISLKSNSHLAESVVVITGASSGIGKELTYRYAERGARVIIGSRNMDLL